ncbi:MAG: hypothetical protein GC159_07225 [Phycisphaera sp.]|nr:hypothetical protein [Phycisphaera sp.]
MRHRCAGLAVVAMVVLGSTGWLAAQDKTQTPIESLLPGDTIAAVIVRDMTALREDWDTHPLMRMWTDPEVVKATAPGREAMMLDKMPTLIQARLGRSLAEALDIIKAQAAIALLPPAEGATGPSRVMLADVGTDKDAAGHTLTAMLQYDQTTAPEGVKYSERLDDYNGLAMHVRVTTQGGKATDGQAWATVGTWLIVADPAPMLKKTVDRVLQLETGKTLLMTAGYKQVQERVGKVDALAYVDLAHVGKLAGAAEGMMGPMLNALGADTLDAGYLALNIEDKYTDIDAGMFYRQAKGLVKLMAFSSSLAEKRKSIPDDVTQVSAMAFSIKKMWAAAKETATAVNPGMGAMLAGVSESIEKDAGVNLDTEILDGLGEQITQVSRLRKAGSLGGVDEVYIVPVKDPDRFATAFTRIMERALGPQAFESRQHANQTIHTAKVPGINLRGTVAEQNFSYVITDDDLLVSLGSDKLLEDILAGDKSPSIWDRPDVKAALAELTPGSAIGYTDAGVAMATMIQAASQSMGNAKLLDPASPISLKTYDKYLGPIVNTWNVQPTGQHGKTRLIHK